MKICHPLVIALFLASTASAGTTVLADPDEAGERLTITGSFTMAEGGPATAFELLAYQTRDDGEYYRGENGLPFLNAIVEIDADGSFVIETIYPGGYPGTRIPKHVHFWIREPGSPVDRRIDEVELLFADDPRVGASQRSSEDRGGAFRVRENRNGKIELHIVVDDSGEVVR